MTSPQDVEKLARLSAGYAFTPPIEPGDGAQGRVVAALVLLARKFSYPTDSQDLLIGGSKSRNIPPGALSAVLEALRAEAIEQCAEVADAEAKYYADQDTGEAWDAGASSAAESIAAAIRKLNDNG